MSYKNLVMQLNSNHDDINIDTKEILIKNIGQEINDVVEKEIQNTRADTAIGVKLLSSYQKLSEEIKNDFSLKEKLDTQSDSIKELKETHVSFVKEFKVLCVQELFRKVDYASLILVDNPENYMGTLRIASLVKKHFELSEEDLKFDQKAVKRFQL